MIGELLPLLKGHSRSHVTCKALCPFQPKTHSNCNKSYKVEYKVTVMVIFFNNVISAHKYVQLHVSFLTDVCSNGARGRRDRSMAVLFR